MRRASIIMVLVAFIFSCGGEWAVLQCIAWGNMVREYSQMVPLGEAVKMTFSGEYPCELCKIIAEKKQSENNKLAALVPHKKLVRSSEIAFQSQPKISEPQTFLVREDKLQTRAEAPPTPPPRFA